MFKLVKKVIRACLPHGVVCLLESEYVRSKREYFHSKNIFKNYYNSISRNYKRRTEIEYTSKKIIYMADGRILVGGLGGQVSRYGIAL